MNKDEKPRYINEDFSDVSTKELLKSLPPLFDSFANSTSTAYLNWRFDKHTEIEVQFTNMGHGYFETAIAMIENCIGDSYSKKRDVWIFPIMFNIVHGIELYLKGINLTLKKHLCLNYDEEHELKIIGSHDIKQLCNESIALSRNIQDEELKESICNEYKFVRKFIDMIYEKTSDMSFARYPVDNKKKDNHFYAKATDNVTINLDVLRQWVLRLHQILDNMDYIYYLNDELLQCMAQLGDY